MRTTTTPLQDEEETRTAKSAVRATDSTGGASRNDEGATAALGLAERLRPAATPTFAIMALLTGLGGSPRNSQDLWIDVP